MWPAIAGVTFVLGILVGIFIENSVQEESVKVARIQAEKHELCESLDKEIKENIKLRKIINGDRKND